MHITTTGIQPSDLVHLTAIFEAQLRTLYPVATLQTVQITLTPHSFQLQRIHVTVQVGPK